MPGPSLTLKLTKLGRSEGARLTVNIIEMTSGTLGRKSWGDLMQTRKLLKFDKKIPKRPHSPA